MRRGIKKAIHQLGEEAVLDTLSEEEKSLITFGGGETESRSTYPGAEVQVIPIITRTREFYHFGFLPDWATAFNDQRKNFNARADSIRIKPTWKKAWNNKQRCLVCSTGFYETDRSTKMRYLFTVKNAEEIFFAGIYNHWTDKSTGEIFKTFAIITTEPNGLVSSVHDRMPVILSREDALLWLKPAAEEETVFSLLKPYPSDLMDKKEEPAAPRKKKGDETGTLDI